LISLMKSEAAAPYPQSYPAGNLMDNPGAPPDSALRLRWRKTWPDAADDFVAVLADDEGSCRVYLHTGVQVEVGRWHWVANLPHRHLASGYASTAREAALAAEAAFFGNV
jgi:hypothetical protein